MRKLLSVALVMFFGVSIFAQTTITGTITEASSGQSLPGANIKVVGKNLGTTTDFDGNFKLIVKQDAPFQIEISSIGFDSKTIAISSDNQAIKIALKESQTQLNEVVVSASRTPERVRESPVTIERIDTRTIKTTSSPSFYDGLENLKGVDINTNSLTFKSINTRGFASFANARFVQLIDGMDNASPALNFPLGNLVGASELDVKSIEILPGASSALYGANAFNGILFITTKDPFNSSGISAYAKTGYTSQDAAGDNQFWDVGIRTAYVFSKKFAAKANFSYLRGTDWFATDYRDHSNFSKPTSAPDYDGLNIYGDEVATTLNFDTLAGLPQGTLGEEKVARTGYKEVNLTNYNAESIKSSLSLNYRPTGGDLELIYEMRLGKGSTIYQGSNRYSLKDLFLQQHKFEIHNKHFMVRAYVTSESEGRSYDMRFTAINMNRKWKSDVNWFTQYAQTFIGARLGLIPGVPQLPKAQANALARKIADTGRLIPGTAAFNSTLASVTSDANLTTGSKFFDASKMYRTEGNYNFSDIIHFADILAGGSFTEFSLNSKGTVFTDANGPIVYNEYGMYIQAIKTMMDNHLKFTGSIRYDKSRNFNGSYSPRVSLVYSAGERHNHNFRASYQTGFRNPTTQDQYIGLDVGRALLVGSAPDNLDRYSKDITLSTNGAGLLGAPSVNIKGRAAYENAFTLSSALAFGAAAKLGNIDPTLLKSANVPLVKPEQVSAYELGYRGVIGKFSIDLSGYYNQYKHFIANQTVIVPLYGSTNPTDPSFPLALAALGNGDSQPFQTYTNSSVDVNSYGASLGVNTKIANYNFGISYTYAAFEYNRAKNPDFEPGFNTPKNKVKAFIGSQNVFKNVGFKVNWRWADSFLWQATFADGLVPSSSVFDAQISYHNPKSKSLFKIGGANLGGKDYYQAVGTGYIGSQFFVSWTIGL